MADNESRGLRLAPPVEGIGPNDYLLPEPVVHYMEKRNGIRSTLDAYADVDGVIVDLGILAAHQGPKLVLVSEEGSPPDAA
jgi:hypothetical protein